MNREIDIIITDYKEYLYTLIQSTPYSFDPTLKSALPATGGVYRIFLRGADWDRSMYIGKTRHLQNRIYNNHLMGNRKASTFRRKLLDSGLCSDEVAVKQYLQSECLVQFVTIASANEITLFEHFAISIMKPKYND